MLTRAPSHCRRETARRQRTQRRLIEPLEERATAGAVQAHGPRVEVGEELRDPRVERGEREERFVAEPREDPAFGDQHPGLHLGLVARHRGPGRQDGRAVMLGELFGGPLQAGLVAAGHDDAALELVADDGCRDPAEEVGKARAWLAIHCGTCWVRVASA
jgi:hypothetical protein